MIRFKFTYANLLLGLFLAYIAINFLLSFFGSFFASSDRGVLERFSSEGLYQNPETGLEYRAPVNWMEVEVGGDIPYQEQRFGIEFNIGFAIAGDKPGNRLTYYASKTPKKKANTILDDAREQLKQLAKNTSADPTKRLASRNTRLGAATFLVTEGKEVISSEQIDFRLNYLGYFDGYLHNLIGNCNTKESCEALRKSLERALFLPRGG